MYAGGVHLPNHMGQTLPNHMGQTQETPATGQSSRRASGGQAVTSPSTPYQVYMNTAKECMHTATEALVSQQQRQENR